MTSMESEIARLKAALNVITNIYAESLTEYRRSVVQIARAALDGDQFVETCNTPYFALTCEERRRLCFE